MEFLPLMGGVFFSGSEHDFFYHKNMGFVQSVEKPRISAT
jgi:hypothetical protein